MRVPNLNDDLSIYTEDELSELIDLMEGAAYTIEDNLDRLRAEYNSRPDDDLAALNAEYERSAL